MNNQESGTLACNYLGYYNDFLSLLRSVSVPVQQRCAHKICFCEKEPGHWRTEAGGCVEGEAKLDSHHFHEMFLSRADQG